MTRAPDAQHSESGALASNSGHLGLCAAIQQLCTDSFDRAGLNRFVALAPIILAAFVARIGTDQHHIVSFPLSEVRNFSAATPVCTLDVPSFRFVAASQRANREAETAELEAAEATAAEALGSAEVGGEQGRLDAGPENGRGLEEIGAVGGGKG
eukprot:5457720-Pleurochrysis_carterae.AAC.2